MGTGKTRLERSWAAILICAKVYSTERTGGNWNRALISGPLEPQFRVEDSEDRLFESVRQGCVPHCSVRNYCEAQAFMTRTEGGSRPANSLTDRMGSRSEERRVGQKC